MKKNKNASVILYVLILVSFALGLSYIVLSKIETTNNKINISKITNKEAEILSENANLNLKYNKKVNSDGNGFEDNYGCPKFNLRIYSGSPDINQNTQRISSLYFNDIENKYYCRYYEDGYEVLLSFSNTNFIDSKETLPVFNLLKYSGYDIELSEDGAFSPNATYPFGLGNFQIDLDSINIPDGENDYLLPDISLNSKKNILGTILEKDTTRVNLFANTEESNNFINSNANNIAPIQKLPELTNGTFKINFSKNLTNANIEVLKFPKNGNQFKNEITLSGQEIEIPNLDFTNNYYQIFLKTQNENDLEGLTYKISETSGAYINPIKDDGQKIEILQNYVFNHSGVDILKSSKFYLDK